MYYLIDKKFSKGDKIITWVGKRVITGTAPFDSSNLKHESGYAIQNKQGQTIGFTTKPYYRLLGTILGPTGFDSIKK
jgi:hypothetical protein